MDMEWLWLKWEGQEWKDDHSYSGAPLLHQGGNGRSACPMPECTLEAPLLLCHLQGGCGSTLATAWIHSPLSDGQICWQEFVLLRVCGMCSCKSGTSVAQPSLPPAALDRYWPLLSWHMAPDWFWWSCPSESQHLHAMPLLTATAWLLEMLPQLQIETTASATNFVCWLCTNLLLRELTSGDAFAPQLAAALQVWLRTTLQNTIDWVLFVFTINSFISFRVPISLPSGISTQKLWTNNSKLFHVDGFF